MTLQTRSSVPPVLFLLMLLIAAGCRLETNEQGAQGEAPGREIIATDAAPEAIGPYSQAIRVGNTLYLAGQIALSPETGEMVEGGIEPETRQVMENLGAVLRAAGFTLADVVQSQVFLADMAEFQQMNAIYGEYFEGDYPVRATVQAARLPRDARVEIMMTAVR